MDYDFLSGLPLFTGCSPEQVKSILKNLPNRTKIFHKEETVFMTGEVVTEFGLVLSGSVRIENIDIMGNRSILGISERGDVFAESYACIPKQPLMVDVVAASEAEVLFINIGKALASNQSLADPNSMMLIRNLLRISSRKNQRLSMRIFHSAPKTIRARLLSYFSEVVTAQGSMEITIPMDRQQLADYLGVDRTALSKELGKMRDEGIITYRKNHFFLNVDPEE